MMTDPISDMLTRIRNAVHAGHSQVSVPASRLKTQIAEILKKEGFITDYQVVPTEPRPVLTLTLRYGREGDPAIHHIERVSKPGRRVYAGVEALRPVKRGLGTAIVSTSQGLLSDRECRMRRIGGEVLCIVW